MGEARAPKVRPQVHPPRTHVSAGRRRRQRLRRTSALLIGATALTTGYAVTRSDAPAVSASARPASPSWSARPAATSTVPPSSTSTRPPSATAVVSPWVPPTKIGLNDPVHGTTNLQPLMARAYQWAAAAAAQAGHPMTIRSGWRSAEYQQILFDRAVVKYGSRIEAAKWVLAPEESAHVQGLAVDVQPLGAARWLQAHGTAYGLCRTYANEWWHFELVAVGPVEACPPMKPSAAG